MADAFFSVQYQILSQALVSESKTQPSDSTAIFLSGDSLTTSCESLLNNTDVFLQQGNTQILEVKGES